LRTITKQAEPHALLNWKRDNQHLRENLLYGQASFPHVPVRAALLAEQHHLCAYTLKALHTVDDCHIEHLLPQSIHPDEAIAYANMLACYPASNSKAWCDYGAQRKASYDPGAAPFVSPLHPKAEFAFSFRQDGTVEGVTPDAVATITVLNLNHPTLVNDRKAVIRGHLEPRSGKPLTAAAAKRLAETIHHPQPGQALPAYGIAIAQQALRHANREERQAAQLKGRARDK
jgi:uncharacterized protein (TIGR02646 family)